MKRKWNTISFCLYTYRIFWQKEKILRFFYVLSLTLVTGVILLFYGDSIKKCSFTYWVKSGMYGMLVLSILIGFFIVWLQCLEERKEDFAILYRLGVKKSILVLTLQLEVFLFQIISTMCAIFLLVIFIFLVGGYEILNLIVGAMLIQLELQIILTAITCIYIRKQ